MKREIIEAALTWTGERFEPNVRIEVGEDGRIGAVDAIAEKPTKRLPNAAILPGFVNAHSHAFQRGLRGRGETFPEEAGSFWSWREEMYWLVESLDKAQMYELSRQAFSEMRSAGITTVGEFHYLHHSSGKWDFAFDEVVLRAAADAGIRIVLLNVYYRHGGLNGGGHQPLAGGQKRFETRSLDAFWRQQDQLTRVIDPATQTLGAAAHSIRAVSLEELVDLNREASHRGMPLHMHVEEQPREIQDCLHHYGRTPMGLVNAHLPVSPMLTAVHCTHTSSADLDDYLSSGGNICICPLTEANLGDGLANVPWMLRNGGRICLGTDSNSRISMAEEMRWLEYGQRLATQSRGVFARCDPTGSVACRLLEAATINGAKSLGVKAGAIRSGHWADFVALDLEHPSLAGADADTLLAAYIFGSDNEAIAETCVGGAWKDASRASQQSRA